MRPENKGKYLGIIDEEVERTRETIVRLSVDRNNADGKMQSRYDTQKEDLNADISVRETILSRTLAFRGFLESAEPVEEVTEGAELTLAFDDKPDDHMDMLYAPIPSSLLPVQVITLKSPLGAAIKGLRAGDAFSYKANDGTIQGKIERIQ